MSDDSKKLASTVGKFDEALEAQIDLRPSDPGARKLVEAAVQLAMKFPNPNLGDIVKATGTVGGWLWQPRKGERVQDFLLGLYERLERTRSEYLKKVEAEDLFEDVIRRVSEQPDLDRRQKLQAIFGHVVEDPRDHVENRLLLRLADELPGEALKALALLEQRLTEGEREAKVGHHVLAARLDVTPEHMSALLGYLVNENIIRGDAIGLGGMITNADYESAGGDLTYLLTPLGSTFLEYGHR